jgi:GTP-binding protein EngB required for normal cell division
MKINTAEFVISNSDVSKCPKDRLPEYAFIGRSNVGKSINKYVDQPKKISQNIWKTRETQLINHFNKQQLVLSRFTRIWLRESIKKQNQYFSSL